MKQTKKITLTALLIALGAALMFVAGLIDTMTLTAAAFAALLSMFVYIEIGVGYAVALWLGTSLAAFLLNPASTVWLEYLLLFGCYPILKAYIERLRRPFWLPVKFVAFNAGLVLLVLFVELIFRVPFFAEETLLLNVLLAVLCNAVFFVFDWLLTLFSRFYFLRIRPRIQKLLK